MKPMDLLKELGWIHDEDIIHAAEPIQKRKVPKMLLIAAIVSVTAVLVGCTAAYLLHVKDLQIGQKTESIPQWGGQVVEQPTEEGGNRKVTLVGGEYQGEKEVSMQVFSMSGLQGSPEFKAAQEWFQFVESFDPDYKISDAHNQKWNEAKEKDPDFESFFPAEYAHYGVYDQAMADKVDEILEKYDLGRITGWKSQKYEFNQPAKDRICRFAGVENFFYPDSEVSIHSILNSSITKENRFYMTCYLDLPWEGIPTGWDGNPYTPLCVVNFMPKGFFEPEVIRLDTEEAVQEENYTTKAGNQVLILPNYDGLNTMILCQRSDGMITLKVESRMDLYYEDEKGTDLADCTYLTMDQLKKISDAFDLSVELNPDWEYVEQENKAYSAEIRRLEQEQRAREATREPDDERDG